MQLLKFKIKWITITLRFFGFKIRIKLPLIILYWGNWKIIFEEEFFWALKIEEKYEDKRLTMELPAL